MEKNKIKMFIDGLDKQPQKELAYQDRKDIWDEAIQAFPLE